MALISKDPDDYVGPARFVLQEGPHRPSVRPGSVMVRVHTDTLALAVATTVAGLVLWGFSFIGPDGGRDDFSPVALAVLGVYFVGLTTWTQAPRRKQTVEPWPADVSERPDRRVALRTGAVMAALIAAVAAYALASSDAGLLSFMATIFSGQAVGMWLALRSLRLLEDQTRLCLYRSSGHLWRNAESKRRFAKPRSSDN